jgi:hypothetical protein
VALLEADMIVQQLPEGVGGLDAVGAASGGQRVDGGTDLLVLVAHARRGLAPIDVGLG